ncbi:MAG: hypothetical protein KA713_13475 [Chryseotalea sp. WA131a]|jgi:hypothetical protein|nr:MAG: hypothetical protein KA713_13475 [Chryseotalea sp. WA131a]
MNVRRLLRLFFLIFCLAGCDFIKNTFEFKKTTIEFTQALLNEEYDKCVSLMALEHPTAKGTNIDTMKMVFKDFREAIVSNFGSQLDYSFMKSEKKFSTNDEEGTSPKTTLVLVQFSNNRDFGVLKVLFDDSSKKIMSINTLDIKKPIPSMTLFWLFGLVALCVPIFNIYVIRKIKRSSLEKKWLKYLAVILINVPAFSCLAVKGISIQPLNFQFLLGVSFSYMGYLNAAWTFGLPLGGLYWFFKLKRISEKEK